MRQRADGGRRAGRGVRGLALTGALAVAALLAGGCAHAAGPAAGAAPARLSDCGGSPQARPAVVVILCADSGIVAHDLRWSGWGKPVATATGTAVVNTCEYTDCHTGSYRSYPVVVVLSRLSACAGGRPGYRRLQYLFVGAQPFGEGNPAANKAAPRTMVTAPPGGPGSVPGMAAEPGCG
jgi:hypothetical protein